MLSLEIDEGLPPAPEEQSLLKLPDVVACRKHIMAYCGHGVNGPGSDVEIPIEDEGGGRET